MALGEGEPVLAETLTGETGIGVVEVGHHESAHMGTVDRA